MKVVYFCVSHKDKIIQLKLYGFWRERISLKEAQKHFESSPLYQNQQQQILHTKPYFLQVGKEMNIYLYTHEVALLFQKSIVAVIHAKTNM